MIQGAGHAALQPVDIDGEPLPAEAAPLPMAGSFVEEEDQPAAGRAGPILLWVVLAVVVAGWIAFLAWAMTGGRIAAQVDAGLIATIGMASAPFALVLLAVVLLGGRAPAAITRARRGLAEDLVALEAGLARVAAQTDAQRAALADHRAMLADLGRETGARLAAITADLASAAASAGHRSNDLAEAGAAARVDLGVLLADLPRAETGVRALGERVRELGAHAQDRTAALDRLIEEMATHGRHADALAGGAAERLAEVLARLEARGAAAGQLIDTATQSLEDLTDSVLGRSGEALEGTRRTLETQSAALDALVDRAATLIGAAGGESIARVDAAIDEVNKRVHALAARLVTEGASARSTAHTIGTALEDIEQRFEAIGDLGASRTADIAEALASLGEHAGGLTERLHGSAAATDALAARVRSAHDGVARMRQELSNDLAPAIADTVERAERARAAVGEVRPGAEEIAGAVDRIVARIGDAEEAIARQRTALAALDRVGSDQAARLARQIETLEAARRLVAQEQDLTLGEGVSAMIRQLQATAVDIARLMALDVPDAEWTAWLRDDSSAPTRRLVRLLEPAEARTISERYAGDDAFADEVDRYVAGFEAMLGRVLAGREPDAFALALVSSEAGRLYVALAQAIARLRN